MNISEESQKGTGLAFETVGYMCEAFVYSYLGASILSVDSTYQAVFMGLLALLALPVVRAIMVYLLPLFYALARKDFPMNSK
jgi:NhaP-type Na+/H+ or K+/H+ antiporter